MCPKLFWYKVAAYGRKQGNICHSQLEAIATFLLGRGRFSQEHQSARRAVFHTTMGERPKGFTGLSLNTRKVLFLASYCCREVLTWRDCPCIKLLAYFQILCIRFVEKLPESRSRFEEKERDRVAVSTCACRIPTATHWRRGMQRRISLFTLWGTPGSELFPFLSYPECQGVIYT